MNIIIVPPEQDGRILSETEVADFLDRQKVPWRIWGSGNGTRTFEEFYRYHRDDQFYIRNGGEIGVTIDVYVAIVMVYHKSRGRWLELFEHHQVSPIGEYLERKNFNGIADTLRRDESLSEGAHRCLKEEIGFDAPLKYDLTPCVRVEIRDPMDSEKWPCCGVTAIYHRHIHECIISQQLFDITGYDETEKNGRKIYFKWPQANHPPLSFK